MATFWQPMPTMASRAFEHELLAVIGMLNCCHPYPFTLMVASAMGLPA